MLRRPPLSSYCLACSVPFRGFLGSLSRLRGVKRSLDNPNLCNRCESHLTVGQIHPVTIVSLSFPNSLGFGRVSLDRLSARELPAIRARFVELFEQRGGLVMPEASSPPGVLQVCFNAPVRIDNPAQVAFDSVMSVFAWVQDEESATGLSFPFKSSIANGYVEIFGQLGDSPVCPIGQVSFRAPELLRYAKENQLIAEPNVACELGFATSDQSNLVIYDRSYNSTLPQKSFSLYESWNSSFFSQFSGLILAILSIPCAVMVVAAPGASLLGLAALFASISPLWKFIGMSYWLRIIITLFAVIIASVNLIRTEISVRRFRSLEKYLGYSIHLPSSQRNRVYLIRFTSTLVLFFVLLEGFLRVFVMKMSLF